MCVYVCVTLCVVGGGGTRDIERKERGGEGLMDTLFQVQAIMYAFTTV